jgi:putative nucleotidyltransferase with HDIG domain
MVAKKAPILALDAFRALSVWTMAGDLIVGSLVEAAAKSISANPLLARVSAYYHDIGKSKMPDYFIENQRSMVSKHEKLTPR